MARIVSELIYKLIADEADLVKGLKAADKQMTDMSKKFKESGKALTLGLTVPIVAAGAAMVKLASDTGEALNAANVVFKDSGKTIEAWGKNAATQAGLTAAEFYQASAVIGAGLTNAGASADQAAKQTIELTKRAADMASIFNTSVDDALGALQAGLRGESEPLRRFAVSLDAVAIEAKAVAMGMVDGAGKATAYGLSQARLAIIMEQSAKFQGDFANTSDGLANSMRITTAQVKEQAAQLGQQLLPIVLEVVQGVQGAVKWFSDLSDEQKKLILITAGVAAAIGPILIGVGQMITTINTLKIAMAGLGAASGPVALAVVGIVALTAAIVALSTAMQAEKKAIDEADFGSMGESLGLASEKAGQMVDDMKPLAGVAKLVAQGTYDTAEQAQWWSAEVSKIAKKYGTTEANVLAVYNASTRITAESKKGADQIQAMLKNTEDLFVSEVKLASYKENISAQLRAKQAKAAIDEANAEAAKQKAASDATAALAAKKQRILDLINETIAATVTEKQALLAQIAELEAAKGINDSKRLEAIRLLKEQVFILDQTELTNKLANEELLIQAEEDKIRTIAMFEAQLTEKKRIEEEKRLQDAKNYIAAQLALVEMATNAVFGLAQQLTKNESMELDNRAIRQKNAVTESSKTEEEKAALIKKIDQDIARQKAELARKNAILEKASAIASIAINTARAVVEALPNVPLSVAIGVLGGIQAAAVLAQPLPEIPSFAQGGSFMVPAGFNNDSFPLPAAMVQSGERVTVETPEQQRQGKNVFQIGTVIASPDGYRELERQLQKYGAVETLRRGN